MIRLRKGLFVGIFYALPWIFVYRGTWESPESERGMPSPSLGQSFLNMRTLLRVRSFRLHVGLYLLGYSALGVLPALFVYYITYAFFGLRPGTSATVLLAPSTGLGLGLSPIVAMPWAMLPESSDADELANGAQRAGAVSGTFTLVRKLVQAGVLWLIGILLSAIGYRADTVQTGRALLGIRSLFSFGPLIFVAPGGVLAALYPITPAANAVLRAEPARRKTRGPSGSVENVPTASDLDALARITFGTRPGRLPRV